MESDWTVACAADDPIVVVPWKSADESLRFVDVRSKPQAVEEIAEARRFPAIAAALRRWNSTNCKMFTVKCDMWDYPAQLFDAFDLSGFLYAHASYIDLVPTDENVFRGFPACEKLVRHGADATRSMDAPNARCEWVLRPALILEPNDDEGIHGFAISLYAWGYGAAPEQAQSTWSDALHALIEPVARVMGQA